AALLAEDVAGARRLGLAALRQRVAFAVARGRGYGLRYDSHLAGFARLMLVYGPDFDQHPAVREILTDRGIPDGHRFDALLKGLLPRHWDERAILGDDALWQDALRAGAG